MNIIKLPIDITVTKEVMEKRVVEEGCLMLLGKIAMRHRTRAVLHKKGVSVRCSPLYPIVASAKV